MSSAVERLSDTAVLTPVAEAAGPVAVRFPKPITVGVIGLLTLGIFYTLYFAQSLFVPVVVAMLLALLLGPAVTRLSRIGVPEGLGAALVVLVLVVSVLAAVYTLSGPAARWISDAPDNLGRIEVKLRSIQKTVEGMKKATEQVEQMAASSTRVPEVVVKGPSLTDNLFNTTTHIGASALITVVMLYFMLASGNLFLLKLVRVLPRLRDKKRAVDIAHQAQHDISAYLITITLINCCLGAATAAAMYLLGMPNAVLWGAMAALFNFVPVLGPLMTSIVLGLVAAVTFDTVGTMIVPPLVFLALHGLEGQFITPILIGRRLTLNPVAVMLALLFWGWLWGVPGALLAVPLLAAFKIMCDRIEQLQAIGEFLGRRETVAEA